MKRNLLRPTYLLSLLILGSCSSSGPTTDNAIDRQAWVSRHNVRITEIDPLAPISLGNGDFAYTLDVTGMQSLEDLYYSEGIPLETRTSWTWHAFPNTENYSLMDASKPSNFHGRTIWYASDQKSPAGEYFRVNPHPVPMGKIGLLRANNEPLQPDDLSQIQQELNLWTGEAESVYQIEDEKVQVETVCHPEKNLIAFKIKSNLLKSGELKPAFNFPYSYDFVKKNKPAFDWDSPDKHRTEIQEQEANRVLLHRSIDTTNYYVAIRWKGDANFEQLGAHQFCMNSAGDELELTCEFLPGSDGESEEPWAEVRDESANSWEKYWTEGAAVDLSESKDPRAADLERRIVLSQYLMKVNYAGSFPPQETGLSNISWYGKHNSEVYWIHAAQFYQWNHTDLLEKGLAWYQQILPIAQADAKSKGFDGARWPKMAGIDGRVSPGGINPFIIWNHPNPIYLCELVYRAHPNEQTLAKYRDMVFETAKFLASYAWYDAETDRYILGPPVKSVTESNEENETKNPTFELTQWYHGLSVAQQWRERLGMERNSHWDDILEKLARPTVVDGKYVELETNPTMYESDGNLTSGMFQALGYLPSTPMIEDSIMKNTFDFVTERNGKEAYVSWAMGKCAMTAARLNLPEKAVDIVCNDVPKATFHKTGYVCRPKEGIKNPAYMPVNGSFLAAIGLMAGGWDNAPKEHVPGFPDNGDWVVKVENMNKLP